MVEADRLCARAIDEESDCEAHLMNFRANIAAFLSLTSSWSKWANFFLAHQTLFKLAKFLRD